MFSHGRAPTPMCPHTHLILRRSRSAAAVPYLHEGSDDDLVVARGIQIEKAVEELLQIASGVDFLLEDHLKHRLPEISIRVVGIFYHGQAVVDFGARGGGGVGVAVAEAAGGGVGCEEGEGGG